MAGRKSIPWTLSRRVVAETDWVRRGSPIGCVRFGDERGFGLANIYSSRALAAPHQLCETSAGAVSLNVYAEAGHFTAGFVGANKPAGLSFHNHT
jgi:hypothetical protein